MIVIGLHGKKGSGKSVIAEHLSKAFGAKQQAFADPIKETLANLFGISKEHFEEQSLKETSSKELYGHTPRYLMQTFGTEWGRDTVHQDIWVDKLKAKLASIRWYDEQFDNNIIVVVSDVRFQSEVDMLMEFGATMVEVVRPEKLGLIKAFTSHRSEQGVDTHGFIRVLNNSSIEALLEKVDDVIMSNLL